MNGNRFLHFSFLPLSMRMVFTMTLLVLGTGYLFAMILQSMQDAMAILP